jgi:uncharacterized protein (DUF2141 family)
MLRVGAVFLMLILATPFALAQQKPVSIRGRVVAAENGVPLRRAHVGFPTRDPRGPAWLTDDDGRFAIAIDDSTPALIVTKGGYASATVDLRRVDGRTAPGRELEIRMDRGAAISGRVLDRSGAPAEGAPVVASRLDAGSGNANVPARFEAEADDLGEYRLFGLSPGRYSVTAGRAAPRMVMPLPRDRAAEPFSPPQIVEIRRGDEQSDVNFIVDIALPSSVLTARPDGARLKGRGVIRGQILPFSGERIVQMPVTLRGNESMTTTITDASSRFVFEGVPSGDYTLVAARDLTAQYGQETDIRAGEVIRVRNDTLADHVGVTRDSAVTGTLLDEFGEPFQGVIVRALQLGYTSGQRVATPMGVSRRTDDRGRYRVSGLLPGSYFVEASSDASVSGGEGQPSRKYVPVFYPSTPIIDGAQSVEVDAGHDAFGLDLAFVSSTAARVSGLVQGEDGKALTGSVRLVVTRRSGAFGREPRWAPIKPGGAFDLPDVPPGDYVVQASGDGRFGAAPEFGAAEVVVADGDPPPLTIKTSPGATLEGRIVIEGGQESLLGRFSLVPIQADEDRGPRDVRTSGVVSSDGTFYQKKLYGLTRFALTTAPEGWYLKSFTIGGADITDGLFDFGSGAVTFDGAEIVLSRAGATVTGTIADARAASGGSYSVVVFATDRQTWFAGSRHLKYGRALQDGSFQVRGLPPGDYWVAAVDGTLGLRDWQNPETLESLVSRGTRLTLGEGQTSSIKLRAIRR